MMKYPPTKGTRASLTPHGHTIPGILLMGFESTPRPLSLEGAAAMLSRPASQRETHRGPTRRNASRISLLPLAALCAAGLMALTSLVSVAAAEPAAEPLPAEPPANPWLAANPATRILDAIPLDRLPSFEAASTSHNASSGAAPRKPSNSNPPKLISTTRTNGAGQPGWWRGMSEWRLVDIEPVPVLEKLWVRINAPDGFLRGLYELDPHSQGQSVSAEAGDLVTIEVDANIPLWGLDITLTDHALLDKHQSLDIDWVFNEQERGTNNRTAWQSYRVCGNEGSEVGVGVRAIAQRRSTPGDADSGAARGLASLPTSPFSLLIAQAADWASTTQSQPAPTPAPNTNESAPAATQTNTKPSTKANAKARQQRHQTLLRQTIMQQVVMSLHRHLVEQSAIDAFRRHQQNTSSNTTTPFTGSLSISRHTSSGMILVYYYPASSPSPYNLLALLHQKAKQDALAKQANPPLPTLSTDTATAPSTAEPSGAP